MYIKDGIAYAGEPVPEIKVCGIRSLGSYKLWLRFTTGETKVFDFSPLLADPAFTPLSNQATFDKVYIDYGVPVWNNGEIDISPRYLYENSVAEEEIA